MSGYTSVCPLAEGGMGTVELVVRQDGAFRRAYAMKRLRPALLSDPHVREMFTHEAQVAGLLHHPNVVSVTDVGEDESGPYLVMDYVQGVSLHELIKEACRRKELIPVQIVVRTFREVALGLHAAHELTDHRGERLELVHRDVSPHNVLIGFDGVSRLTDFGIAKALQTTDNTATGILKGKMGYFAPEQLRFQPATRSSDLFSLGVCSYEALICQRLYKRSTPADTALAIFEEPPPDLYDVRQDVHPALEELLLQLVAKDPALRPKSAEEVAIRLETILADILSQEAPLLTSVYLRERFEGRAYAEQQRIEGVTQQTVPEHEAVRSPRRFSRSTRIAGLALLCGAVAATAWAAGMIPGRPADVPPEAPGTRAIQSSADPTRPGLSNHGASDNTSVDVEDETAPSGLGTQPTDAESLAPAGVEADATDANSTAEPIGDSPEPVETGTATAASREAQRRRWRRSRQAAGRAPSTGAGTERTQGTMRARRSPSAPSDDELMGWMRR